MNSVACPDDAALERYAGGLLEAQQHQQIADHLLVCARCREIVSHRPHGDSSLNEAGATTKMPPAAGENHPTAREPIAETRALAAECAELEADVDLGFLKRSPDQRSLGLIGKYEVSRVLGRGGMGIVFQAFDEALHRTVAVKVMAPELASNVKARRRFVREA